MVSLKESRRHGADLELAGFEDVHDPGYLLLRIYLPRTPVNKGHSRPEAGYRGGADMCNSYHGELHRLTAS